MQIEKVRMSLWMILQKKLCRLVIILIHLHGYQIQVLLTHIYQNEVNKMRVTEIDTVLETIEYAGETFINLQELDELLKGETLLKWKPFCSFRY